MAITLKLEDFPSNYSGCVYLTSITMREKSNPFKIIFSYIRTQGVFNLLNDKMIDCLTLPQEELIKLTDYNYNRTPRTIDLAPEDITKAIEEIVEMGFISEGFSESKPSVCQDGGYHFLLSGYFTKYIEEEAKIVKIILENVEKTDQTFDLIRLLLFFMMNSANKNWTFGDQPIHVGEAVVGKNGAMINLGIPGFDYDIILNELISLGILRQEITDPAKMPDGTERTIKKHFLVTRFKDGVDIFKDYFDKETTKERTGNKIKELKDLADKVLSSTQEIRVRPKPEGKSILDSIMSLLPQSEQYKDKDDRSTHMNPIGLKLKIYTIKEAYKAFTQIHQEHAIKAFLTRDEIYDKFFALMDGEEVSLDDDVPFN